MNKEDIDEVKLQLHSYLQYLNKLREESMYQISSYSILGMFRGYVTIAPSGVEYELGFTRDELQIWQQIEKNL